MTYTKNPHVPKVRRDASAMVRKGYSKAEVGRRYGVGSSTVCKWIKKATLYGIHPIPTLSSKPKSHPRQLSDTTVDAIVRVRLDTNRCSEVVHETLRQEDISVSLSSVKRTLERNFLLKKRSPWKRYHPPVERPKVVHPGDLVEADTIHLMTGAKTRIYVFTLIDLYSRWVYAKAYEKINGAKSVAFVKEAKRHAPFLFQTMQTDHGSEFGTHFTNRIGILHRHTRVGKPNDNAHIERFNRTLQEECLDKYERQVDTLNKALKTYLAHYNTKRLHLGINLKTPNQLLTECVQAID
jgi:transposase InsO family protein